MMKSYNTYKLNFITWLFRLIVGCTFIISGFVKAIDPWGFLYKTEDYLAALSLDIWPNLQLVGVFGLSAVEFLVGIFILFGCFRKSVTWVALLIMSIMLPLTLWLAVSDPVKDCGCFGDAFIISNWASFWKNILLTIGILWLLKYNSTSKWLITPALQWLGLVFSGLFIVAIEFYGYVSQPLIDFRHYKIGLSIIDSDYQNESHNHLVFIYEKNGIRREVDEDEELPDEEDGWIFIDRKERSEVIKDDFHNDNRSERNFRIWSQRGEEDLTEDVILTKGNEILVLMPDLREVSPATTWKLNSLYEWAERHNVKMIAVVAGSPAEISEWKDISMASYPIFTADDTQIKEVVRGNPGVVYLVDGIIKWKSTLTALNVDDFMSPEISDDASSFGIDNERILLNCVFIFFIVLITLVFLSYLPQMKDYYFNSNISAKQSGDKVFIHDDTVHHEE